MKNRLLILQNLEEAKRELEETIGEIAGNNDYSEEELRISLEHAYHHMNFAWNIQM